MRILVTGANGQVGRSMLDLNGQDGHEIIGLNRQQFDLTKPDDFDRIVDQIEPDAIVNAAAYTMVDRAEDEPELAYQINAVAPGSMASVAAAGGLPFIQISTDYVFDGAKEEPYDETDSPSPVNVYGKVKLLGEVAAQESYPETIILRTSWVFSPYGKNFLRTIRTALLEKKQLRVVRDQIGSPTYAPSVADTILRILKKKLTSEIFHFSGLNSVSWFDFAKFIEERIYNNNTSLIESCASSEYNTVAERPRNTCLDNTKIVSKLGIHRKSLLSEITICLSKIDKQK